METSAQPHTFRSSFFSLPFGNSLRKNPNQNPPKTDGKSSGIPLQVAPSGTFILWDVPVRDPRCPCGHPGANNPEIRLSQSFSPTFFFPSLAPPAVPDPHSRPISRKTNPEKTKKTPKNREKMESRKKTTKVSQRVQRSSWHSGARHSRDLGAFRSRARTRRRRALVGTGGHWWALVRAFPSLGRSFLPL